MKKNCWEVMQCDDPANCPAFNENRLTGTHRGKNAGRCCWVVAGTLCFGEPAGEFARQIDSCETCAFYNYVLKEEGEDFSLLFPLLLKLHGEILHS